MTAIANRAEVAAMQLRRLARSVAAMATLTAQPNTSPLDVTRAQSTVDADRAECAGALERLVKAATSLHHWADALRQTRTLRDLGAKLDPETLRSWADAWDAYALDVDDT